MQLQNGSVLEFESRRHRSNDTRHILRRSGRLIFIPALILMSLQSESSHGAVVASWNLAGQTPMSGTTMGPHSNPTHIFPFSGTNTTSEDIQYSGDFSIHVKTSSEVQNTTVSGGELQEASASLTITSTGHMSGPGPYPPTLTGTGFLGGTVTVGINSFHDGSVNFLGSHINPLEDLFFPDSGTYNVSIPLTPTTVAVAADGSFPLNMSLRSESWGRVGTTLGDFSHTLKLTSLLLPNGHTPESEGWTLTFDDGGVSPNIPEPFAHVLLALGTVDLCLLTRQRRRNTGRV